MKKNLLTIGFMAVSVISSPFMLPSCVAYSQVSDDLFSGPEINEIYLRKYNIFPSRESVNNQRVMHSYAANIADLINNAILSRTYSNGFTEFLKNRGNIRKVVTPNNLYDKNKVFNELSQLYAKEYGGTLYRAVELDNEKKSVIEHDDH